jgi:PAS domain S-box-containing protein
MSGPIQGLDDAPAPSVVNYLGNLWRRFVSSRGVMISIVGFNVLLTAVMWAVVVELVRADRLETIRTAVARNDNLATAFEQYVVRTIESADAAVTYLIREYARRGKTLDLVDFVRNFTIDTAALTGVVLADERGNGLTTANGEGTASRLNVSDREHFRVHINGDSGRLFIGKPVVGRVTGRLVVPLTKRINKSDGTFGGVAMALIEPTRFTDVLRDTRLSSLDLMSVVGLDGITRARLTGTYPSAGEDIGKSPLFKEQAGNPTGNYFAPDALNGVPRYFSYRTLENYQVMVTVGFAESEILAEYYGRRAQYFSAAGLVTVLIGIFTLLLIVAIREQRRAAALVAHSHGRFLATFNQAAVGIAHCGLDGRFLNVNQRLCDMLGYSAMEFLSLTVADITWPEDVASSIQLLKNMLVAPVGATSEYMEKRYLHKNGSIVWGALTVSLIRDESGAPDYYAAVTQDISKRHKAEEALRANQQEQDRLARQIERERSQLVEAQLVANVGSWETEFPGLTVIWSAQTYRIFEVDPASFEPTHARFLDLIHPEDRAKVDAAFADSLDKQTPSSLEHRIVTPNGAIKTVEERWKIFHDVDGRPVRATGTCQDISMRKEAEKSLQDYASRLQAASRQLLTVQEDERRRLARELHDKVGQELTALNLNLSLIRDALPDDLGDKVAIHLDDTQKLLEDTTQHLRNVMVELRPAGLDELGLIAAVKEHAQRVARRGGYELAVNGTEPSPRFEPATEIALFRIVQEALNNIAKHAGATQISVELREMPGLVRLTVKDNGNGFDTSLKPMIGVQGMGLTTMRERAEAIGAHCTIESAIAKGAVITVDVPRAAMVLERGPHEY